MPGGHRARLRWTHRGASLHDHARCPNHWPRKQCIFSVSHFPFFQCIYLSSTRDSRRLSIVRPLPSRTKCPADRMVPTLYLVPLSQAMSLVSDPDFLRSFCEVVFLLLASALTFSRSSPWVEVWCTAASIRGVASLVSLPSSFQPLRVVAGQLGRRGVLEANHISSLRIPIPATWTSWVDGVFNSAILMWVFAAGVGR